MAVYRSSGSAWLAAVGDVGQSSTSRPAVRQDDAAHARPLVQSEGQVPPDSHHHRRHQLGSHLVDRLSQRHAAGVTSLRIGVSVAICVPNVENQSSSSRGLSDGGRCRSYEDAPCMSVLCSFLASDNAIKTRYGAATMKANPNTYQNPEP